MKYTDRERSIPTPPTTIYDINVSNFSNSKFLEFHKAKLVRIQNTFQSTSKFLNKFISGMIPKLANGLDKILNIPGIFPTESINRLNHGKLGDFYMRLPQYSEIDDS